ncbi:hypothetical protein MMU05_03915 [Aquiflexum sp. AIY15W]|nr:hypothetical protein [Cognataquiflexum rubidum]
MDVRCYDSRFDIHLNSCLPTEMHGSSLPHGRRGSSDTRLPCLPQAGVPAGKKYRVTDKEAYIHERIPSDILI